MLEWTGMVEWPKSLAGFVCFLLTRERICKGHGTWLCHQLGQANHWLISKLKEGTSF